MTKLILHGSEIFQWANTYSMGSLSIKRSVSMCLVTDFRWREVSPCKTVQSVLHMRCRHCLCTEIILTLPDLRDRKNLYQSISEKGKVNFNGFPIFPINWVHIYQSISNTEYTFFNEYPIYFSHWVQIFQWVPDLFFPFCGDCFLVGNN